MTLKYSVMQSDENRWKIDTFWEAIYNFWTNCLILILKTYTRPYLCLAKVVILLRTCLNVLFISRCMKNVRFRTDLIAPHCMIRIKQYTFCYRWFKIDLLTKPISGQICVQLINSWFLDKYIFSLFIADFWKNTFLPE